MFDPELSDAYAIVRRRESDEYRYGDTLEVLHYDVDAHELVERLAEVIGKTEGSTWADFRSIFDHATRFPASKTGEYICIISQDDYTLEATDAEYPEVPLYLARSYDSSDAEVRDQHHDIVKGDERWCLNSWATSQRGESDEEFWGNVESLINVSRRVLLWGPPGTGKTYAAANFGLNGRKRSMITMTPDTSFVELRGMYLPTGNGVFEWDHGSAVVAWQEARRLVVNEIDHSSGDALSFMHVILDDPEFAELTLPNRDREVVKPADAFDVVATMNGEPEDLPEALADRFPVTINIDRVHPAALAKLSEQWRGVAKRTIVAPKQDRIGLRQWLEFDRLTTQCDVPVEVAAMHVLRCGDDIMDAVMVASA